MKGITKSILLESLPNIASQVELILLELKSMYSLSDEAFYQIMLCAVEAVNNAAEHGNDYSPQKKVMLKIFSNDEFLELTVIDEGIGFVPDVKKAYEMIESEENKYATRGRGVFLLHELMDEVIYKQDSGTKVIMKYYFSYHK